MHTKFKLLLKNKYRQYNIKFEDLSLCASFFIFYLYNIRWLCPLKSATEHIMIIIVCFVFFCIQILLTLKNFTKKISYAKADIVVKYSCEVYWSIKLNLLKNFTHSFIHSEYIGVPTWQTLVIFKQIYTQKNFHQNLSTANFIVTQNHLSHINWSIN